MTATTKPSTSFWVVSIIALVWNIMGLMAFFMDAFVTTEALEKLPEAERQLYLSYPGWIKVFYGLSVFGGTLGCILLLMKNGLAFKVFILSLIAILIQMGHSIFFTKALEVYGNTALVMPTIVIAIAIFLVWYSKSLITKGLLK